MSTASATLTCKTGSKRKEISYIPGSAVEKRVPKRPKTGRRPSPCLPSDVLHKILMIMVERHEALSVIKLSMVNRRFREDIADDLPVWYKLYLHWRGPVDRQRHFYTNRGVVQTRPTFPLSVPNFRTKTPPLT
jgi:hypothetical protein